MILPQNSFDNQYIVYDITLFGAGNACVLTSAFEIIEWKAVTSGASSHRLGPGEAVEGRQGRYRHHSANGII
jgi:hypothetical protein